MAATDSGFSEYLPLVRPLDEEQARLVEILVAARGSEVSFEELRRRGIENPAVLAYELEIAGLPIAHVQRMRPGAARARSACGSTPRCRWRSPPRKNAQSRAATRASRWTGVEAGNAGHAGNGAAASSIAPRPRRDLLPGIAIGLAAFVLVVIIVALASGTGSGPAATAGTRAARPGGSAATQLRAAARAPPRRLSPPASATATSPHITPTALRNRRRRRL